MVAILISRVSCLSNFIRGQYEEHFWRNYFEFALVVQEMLLKDISIFSSGGHFVQQSITVCAILVEGIMRNISVKLF